MRRLNYYVDLKFDYGEEVYINIGANKKTWIKGIILGWNIGHPSYPAGIQTLFVEDKYCEECREEEKEYCVNYSLPITYIIRTVDKDGKVKNYKRPEYSVYKHPSNAESERLERLKEEKIKLEAEIERLTKICEV